MTTTASSRRLFVFYFFFFFLQCLGFFLSSSPVTTVESFSIQAHPRVVTNQRGHASSLTSSSSLLAAVSAKKASNNSDDNNDNTPIRISSNQKDEANDGICWHPCSIQLSKVSHQYPETLWRTLTSSEPRRQWAIEDVSLTLQQQSFVLLVGDSSSGKSTLLKLILGLETPSSGTIEIITTTTCATTSSRKNDDDDDDNQKASAAVAVAVPVLLEQRPVYSNRAQTVQVILQERLQKILTKQQLPSQLFLFQLQQDDDKGLLIIQNLCDTLDLPLTKKGVDLSPSEEYRCAMAEASLESMVFKGSSTATSGPPGGDDCKQEPSTLSFPAPILFLDEWMDKETSTVVQNVQASILNLVEKGAIVVSITHKPNLYYKHQEQSTTAAAAAAAEKEDYSIDGSSSKARFSTITLRRGKIVVA